MTREPAAGPLPRSSNALPRPDAVAPPGRAGDTDIRTSRREPAALERGAAITQEENWMKLNRLGAAIAVASLIVTACGGGASPTPAASTGATEAPAATEAPWEPRRPIRSAS